MTLEGALFLHLGNIRPHCACFGVTIAWVVGARCTPPGTYPSVLTPIYRLQALVVGVAECPSTNGAGVQEVSQTLLARAKQVAVFIHASSLIIEEPIAGTKGVKQVALELALVNGIHMEFIIGVRLLA